MEEVETKPPMRFNVAEKPEDFIGNTLSWEDIARALWDLLDSIDTLPDMLKPGKDDAKASDKCWRMMVKRAEKRHRYLVSDGYELNKYPP